MSILKTITSTVLALVLCACGGGGGDSTVDPQPTIPSPGIDIMSYGFSVMDSAGRLVVSESAPALHFVGKATYSSSVATAPGGTIQTYTVTGALSMPIPFVYPGGAYYAQAADVTHVSGTTYSIKVYTNAPNGVVQVYCFATLGSTSQASGGSDRGLVVYTSTGALAFSTNDRPLLLDDAVTVPSGTATTYTFGAPQATVPLNVAGLAKPAITGEIRGRLNEGGVPPSYGDGTLYYPVAYSRSYVPVLQVTGGSLLVVNGPQVQSWSHESTGVITGSWGSNGSPILVIDASRYD